MTSGAAAVHETGDARAPFRLRQDYRRRTLTAGTGHLLVQRAVPWAGHCSFDSVVRERAFDDLAARLERGVVPPVNGLPTANPAALGLRWSPTLHPEDSARGLRRVDQTRRPITTGSRSGLRRS